MVNDIFLEISLLIVLATIVSVVIRLLKQPLIIGYIVTGIIVGPFLLNIIQDVHTLEILGKFGIALLLFIVGLGLNPKVIKDLGKIVVLTGVGQVMFTTILGFMLANLMGFTGTTALFIAVGLAFSSTIIVLKLLSDKKEVTQLHGRIAIGFLLVQDIIATFALVIASAAGKGNLDTAQLALLGLKGVGLVIGIIIVTQIIIKPLGNFLSKSHELLFLFALAWGFGIGSLFIVLGFSLEVGALFAGVSLASMDYAADIGSRLRPLRDFFIVVFFITLGASLELSAISSIWWQALLLSHFVLIGNPIIVMAIMGLLGYTKKTGFKTSLAVAQISEFSLIFVLLGHDLGYVNDSGLALITFIALITFAVSSYMIIYADKLYVKIEGLLSVFERRSTINEHKGAVSYDAIIFGFKKGGAEFARSFKKQKKKIIVIDHDPEVIDEVHRRGFAYTFGDASEAEVLDEIGIGHTKSVISTITNQDTTEFIVRQTVKHNPRAIIICSADSAMHAKQLYELGATYVMMPHTIGTEKISDFIAKHGLKRSEFKSFRDKHLLYLANYIDELPEKHSAKLGQAVVEKMAQLVTFRKK